MELTSSVAVVTGATRGIGREVALRLADAGCDLVVTGRSTGARPDRRLPGTLDEVAGEIEARGRTALPVAADLADPHGVDTIVAAVEREFGRCDLLVNNAAISYLGPFVDVELSKWRKAIEVDLLAPVALAHALVPGMIERDAGVVLNISSLAAVDDPVPCLPYGAAKAGIERISTGLAKQLAETAVSVVCVRIDEGVATEAMELSRPDRDTSDLVSAPAMASALVWAVEHASQHSGEVITMERLRALGALDE